MDTILYIIGGPLFIASVAAHLYVRIRLRPKQGSDLDDYYYEFEDRHPVYAHYTKLLALTFAGIAVSVLLLFIAMAL